MSGRAVRELLIAIAFGVLIGGGEALGLGKVTPASMGFMAFAGVLVGFGMSRSR